MHEYIMNIRTMKTRFDHEISKIALSICNFLLYFLRKQQKS